MEDGYVEILDTDEEEEIEEEGIEEESPLDRVLEGHTCPCCEKGFYRAHTIVYAQLTRDVDYYFHKTCLSRFKVDFLEKLGFDMEEREGSTFDF